MLYLLAHRSLDGFVSQSGTPRSTTRHVDAAVIPVPCDELDAYREMSFDPGRTARGSFRSLVDYEV